MRPPSSTVQLLRLTLHVLLAGILVTLVRLQRDHSRPPVTSSFSPAPALLASTSGLPSDALLQLYIDCKTSLFALLLVHLPWLLSLGGAHDAGEMVRGGGLADLGLAAFEQGSAVLGAGLWAFKCSRLRQHAVSGPTRRIVLGTGAAAGLSFALVALLFYQSCAPVDAADSRPVDDEAAAGPLADKAIAAHVPRPDRRLELGQDGTQLEGAKVEALIISGTLVPGALFGLGLVIGIQAAALTIVLGYQPAALFLPILVCSLPLLLRPSAISTPRLSLVLSLIVLVWYRSAMTYALDERGAPTCGVWEPHADETIRRLAPVLCKLARWVYNLSWTFLAGLTWLLVDLYACLSDDIDPADEVVLKLGGDGQLHEQDVSLGDILRDLVRATFADLIASIQRLPAACLTRPDGLVHLA